MPIPFYNNSERATRCISCGETVAARATCTHPQMDIDKRDRLDRMVAALAPHRPYDGQHQADSKLRVILEAAGWLAAIDAHIAGEKDG